MLETLLYIVFFLIVLPLIGLIVLAAIQSTPQGKLKVDQAEIDRQIQGIPAAVRVAIEQEKMPSEELKLLHNSLFTLGGIETDISEIVQNGIWGISDPMYGLYRKNLKQSQQMPKDLAIDTIKNLYSKYPWTTHWAISGFIKSFEESKQPKLMNAAIAFRSYFCVSNLPWLQKFYSQTNHKMPILWEHFQTFLQLYLSTGMMTPKDFMHAFTESE